MVESQGCEPGKAETFREKWEEAPIFKAKESWRNDHEPTCRFLLREPQRTRHAESVKMGEIEVLCDQDGSVVVQ
jgi:hypothetical protein